MDPLTQGALGATFAQAAPTKTRDMGIAAGLGLLSGMAPDLDILIQSSVDPLLALEYHRHFTHSFIFIPVGALLVALAIHFIVGRRWQLPFVQTFACCLAGYATHALLDSATSYGTRLFWPFSDLRVSGGIVSIIDPLVTVPLLAMCAMSIIRGKKIFAWAGLIWLGVYLSIGAFQHNVALAAGQALAASRGHEPIRFEIKPSFANLLVWKVVYETSDTFYVDAIRVGFETQIYPGDSIPKLDLSRDFSWLDPNTQQAKDIHRFSNFSKGFVSLDPTVPNRIVDVRYSLVPNEINSIWWIDLTPNAPIDAHVSYGSDRGDVGDSTAKLWQMLLGR